MSLRRSIPNIFWLGKDPTALPSANNTPVKFVWIEMHILKISLDLGYYVGVIPYHIKYDRKMQTFIVHKNKLQMIYCMIFQTVAILINHIQILKIDKVVQDTTIYFQLFRRVTVLIMISAWFETTWSKPNELKAFASMSYMALTGNYFKCASRIVTTICLIYGICMIFSIFIVEGETYTDPLAWMTAYLKRAELTFHLQAQSKASLASTADDAISIQQITLTLIEVLLGFCHDTSFWVLYMIQVSIVVVIWFHVKAFQDIIHSCSSPIVICQQLYALKDLSNIASSILGLVLLAWVVYIIPFTAITINGLFSHSNWFIRLYYIIYFGHVILFLALAADACSKVKDMKQWLIRDDTMTHFDGRKHNALLMDLSNNPIAIRSYGVFTITYGFIGNLFTLVTSFFIIITQFKMTLSEPVTSEG